VHLDFTGRPLMTGRYVQWTCSSSLLVYMVSSLGNATLRESMTSLVFQVGKRSGVHGSCLLSGSYSNFTFHFFSPSACQAVCIVAGFFASYLPWPFWPLCLCVCVVAFCFTMRTIVISLNRAIDGSLHVDDEFFMLVRKAALQTYNPNSSPFLV
jgi:hypothetical protein